MGRFINADGIVGANGDLIGYNQFAYCINNPVIFLDESGYAPRYTIMSDGGANSATNYFIVYNRKGKDLKEQAKWMANYAYKNKDIKYIYVVSKDDFIKAWNSIPQGVNSIHLYLHGGEGVLYLYNENMYSEEIFQLKSKSANMIYLYACNGGTGNYSSIAAAFATLNKNTKVRALVDGSVSFRNWNQWFARKPLAKLKAAYWVDFYYGKYKGKMSISIDKIGKSWRLN